MKKAHNIGKTTQTLTAAAVTVLILTALTLTALSLTALTLTGCDNHNHDFGTEWKSNETQHWHECSCGEKKDAANHTWGNWTRAKEPTATEDGEETRKCTICEKTEKKSVLHCNCDPDRKWGIDEMPCTCGKEVCGCKAYVYGNLNLDGGGTIPIYRTTDVTDIQMNTLVATEGSDLPSLNVADRVQAGYERVVGFYKPKINTSNVNAIWITDWEWEEYDISKKVIKLPYNCHALKMASFLQTIATYDIK